MNPIEYQWMSDNGETIHVLKSYGTVGLPSQMIGARAFANICFQSIHLLCHPRDRRTDHDSLSLFSLPLDRSKFPQLTLRLFCDPVRLESISRAPCAKFPLPRYIVGICCFKDKIKSRKEKSKLSKMQRTIASFNDDCLCSKKLWHKSTQCIRLY